MKKIFLLPLCISCVCGISACSNHSFENQDEIFIAEEDTPIIDATTNPGSKCGVDGISCNDTPLVNYTRTEADYREYGEKTRRDHLYTQSGAGNNLTASIRPTVEDDVVIANPQGISAVPTEDVFERIANPQGISAVPTEDVFERTANPQGISAVPTEDVFERTASADLETQPSTYSEAPDASVGRSKLMSGCEMICYDGGCGDLVTDGDMANSEFTDESFDIADYVKPDDEEIKFTEIGSDQLTADVGIKEVKISDDTILTWEAEEGDNLRELLTKWSAMAGWKLLWQTNRNYILSAGVMFKGKFTDVSSALVRAFARARPAPIATYYKGNRVIVVETMENENAY